MNKYRFVTPLTQSQVDELTQWIRHQDLHERTRIRLRSILLSNAQYSLDEISEIQQVNRDTVSLWLTAWETDGIEGLFDRPKSNRRPVLNDSEQEVLRQLLSETPRSAKEVSLKLEQQTGKSLSHWSIRRWAKRFGFQWKRARKSLSAKRKPEEFKAAQQDLNSFQELETQGQAQVFFFDATGFDLTPSVPYAWQPLGQKTSLLLPAASSKRLNVIGFLNRQQELIPFLIDGTCTAAVVKSCFDAFCQQYSRTVPVIVVLDNAPVHTAKLFLEAIPDWQAQGVFPYFLPSYSPELNLIEILWKRIKYSWLPRTAYESFQTLTEAVTQILLEYGDKYQIGFA
jgi:transposase